MTPRLDLLLAQAPADSSGAFLSRLGRESLSRLAARHGFDCPVDGWSPRGHGAPRHSSLPLPWQACLSHRGRRVVAGLATVPVGIDIEHSRPRHGARLAELVDLLPEARVRHAILEAANPLKAFYRAWTLHEALFKLDSLSGLPPTSVLETRLARLLPGGGIQAWQWQHDGWTLSICSHERRLGIRSLPRLAITKSHWP
ncbi:4'-phosphopantetheinyl transferase family protein [Billgrantia sp. Q4P2]|uniref:4'-phosphopantetheinyl transferase family protein n=1 Tax=Billgrantia sp. Q4P2 TaxID=3463857 RepID=UPI004056482F